MIFAECPGSAFTTAMVVSEFVGVLVREYWTVASNKWMKMAGGVIIRMK